MDLLSIIQQDVKLKRVSAHRGGEYHGPCPFCGGKDRFRVQTDPPFWACRQCEKSGDAIAYQVETKRISAADAYKLRHGEAVTPGKTPTRTPPATPPDPCDPPSEHWQGRAMQFVTASMSALWSDAGGRALAWLHGRGLTDATLDAAGIGYHTGNPENEPREVWGLDAAGKPVWTPRGVVIPWTIGGDLWRVNIRRPAGDPKYIGPAGWHNALFNAHALATDKPAILVEGELDALTLAQVCGDLVTPCATGSADGARRARWIAKLALCPRVLVAFDADGPGDEAREYWLKVLSNGRYWRPFWGDANQMFQDGADLRGWIEAGLV